jgi:hypothetical protein
MGLGHSVAAGLICDPGGFSEIESQRKEFHVHSRVEVSNTGIGHVLKAHAGGEAIGNSPIQAGVARKLKIIAEIPGIERRTKTVDCGL